MTRNAILLSVVAAIALVAVAWMFLIQPQNEQLAEVRADIEAQEGQATSLESQIAALEQVRSQAPEIEAQIADVEAIVPTDPALPAALRQIQAAADDAGVTLTSMAPERPVSLEDPLQPKLHAIPVAMTLEGSYFQTVDFLRRLEDPAITARGMEVTTVNVTRNDEAYPQLEVAVIASMYAVLEEAPQPVEETPVAPAAATDETGADEATDTTEATAGADGAGEEDDA